MIWQFFFHKFNGAWKRNRLNHSNNFLLCNVTWTTLPFVAVFCHDAEKKVRIQNRKPCHEWNSEQFVCLISLTNKAQIAKKRGTKNFAFEGHFYGVRGKTRRVTQQIYPKAIFRNSARHLSRGLLLPEVFFARRFRNARGSKNKTRNCTFSFSRDRCKSASFFHKECYFQTIENLELASGTIHTLLTHLIDAQMRKHSKEQKSTLIHRMKIDRTQSKRKARSLLSVEYSQE